jgi:5-methylthioribose kinase
MAYIPLNNDTVPEYIRTRPALAPLFPENTRLSASEIGDGNLNLVFWVENGQDPRQSAIVKQALPYLRVAGEAWPLTRDRIRIETRALRHYQKLVPGLVPEIYDYDDEMSLVVMEALRGCQVMRRPLVQRRRFPHFVDHISTFLAHTLFFTSDLYLTGLEKKELQAAFINPHLGKIQEDFVFTNPFMDSPDNIWNPLVEAEVQAVRGNSDLKLSIARLKEGYMTKAQALIHSDLHTGSIMLNEYETRVIDPEFAFFGPMGFDVGALFSNLILNYLSHFAHTLQPAERAGYQAYLLDMVRNIWLEFETKFDRLWQKNNRGDLMPARYWDFPGGQPAFADFRCTYLLGILRDTAGFGGAKILRRMMGIVSVWDVTSIIDLKKRADVERLAIRIGSRWVLERDSVNTIDDLLAVVVQEATNLAAPLSPCPNTKMY